MSRSRLESAKRSKADIDQAVGRRPTSSREASMALILKRASTSRLAGEWSDDDFDDIMRAAASPEGSPWMWTLAFGHHEDRTPTHGYAATREGAMAAFAK